MRWWQSTFKSFWCQVKSWTQTQVTLRCVYFHALAFRCYHTRSDRDRSIVFSSVRLCVCLSVCQHDNSWTVRDIITKFSGHRPMIKRADTFKNGYIGVRGWWESVSGVLILNKYRTAVDLNAFHMIKRMFKPGISIILRARGRRASCRKTLPVTRSDFSYDRLSKIYPNY